ncbi:hypothetical protein TRFO_09315 [Tritrichomonas foetus]|uniref:Uncharacterized protein n=1 Tax=Tritrichomonas foetus TaxID=1144522 RepID=A0A1J4JG20_9EUKA|nr:hypothetical protein TRFO_09315 [Tritrichomonas foetus]|eukprot:OHS97617.1 hypothetical protein TRFO_09315 [Tritrichomonas foetus]
MQQKQPDIRIDQFLQLLSSPDEQTCERAARYIIIYSTMAPQMILQNISYIQLFINSLCSVRNPKWSSISALILALSNAINIDQSLLAKVVLPMIQISQTVTKAYFASSDESAHAPFLLPLTQSLEKLFLTQKIKLTPEIFLSISEHCSIGFLPNASYVPFIVKLFPAAIEAIGRIPTQSLERICQPISSPSKDVVICYLTLWSYIMSDLFKANRFDILVTLTSQIGKILEFIEADTFPFSSPANYLLDCIKSSIPERATLATQGASNRDKWLRILKDFILSMMKKEESDKKESDMANVVVKEAPPLKGIEAEFTLVSNKKKPKKCFLFYLPEAKIFAYGPNNDLRKASYLHISERESVTTLDEENIMFITTFKKEKLQFKLNSSHYLQQFCRALSPNH